MLALWFDDFVVKVAKIWLLLILVARLDTVNEKVAMVEHPSVLSIIHQSIATKISQSQHLLLAKANSSGTEYISIIMQTSPIN